MPSGGRPLGGRAAGWRSLRVVLARREALRDLYRNVLRSLATALIDSGQAREATAVARELVRVDRLDEPAHRLRIEAHQAAGDRAGAVRAYHECVATLERELGVEPSPATVAAYAAVLESPGAPSAESRGSTTRARANLVGRDVEWQQLVAMWRGTEHGPPGVAVVTGEAGIGKTRLVEELRGFCIRADATVADARSYATKGDLAYGVVTAWLRSPDIQVALGRLPREQRGDLAWLLPESGSPVTIDGLDDAGRRRRIFDAAVAAIAGEPDTADRG